MGYAPTAPKRGPGDGLRMHGGQAGVTGLATPPTPVRRKSGDGPSPQRRPGGGQGRDSPPWRPGRGQETGNAPTAARRGLVDGTRPTVARRGPVDETLPHGGQVGSRGRATPPRRPDGAQRKGHAPMAARRGQVDGPRPHGSQAGAVNK